MGYEGLVGQELIQIIGRCEVQFRYLISLLQYILFKLEQVLPVPGKKRYGYAWQGGLFHYTHASGSWGSRV